MKSSSKASKICHRMQYAFCYLLFAIYIYIYIYVVVWAGTRCQPSGWEIPAVWTSTRQSKGQTNKPLVCTSGRVAILTTARRAAKKHAASRLYRHTNGRLVSGAWTCRQLGGPEHRDAVDTAREETGQYEAKQVALDRGRSR